MSKELKAIYDNARPNVYFYLPERLQDEMRRTLIARGKVVCRRWEDGRVMYMRVR